MIKKLLFIGVLILTVGLRLVLLDTVPPSASLDEATIGWNAYSLLLTGHDEYGYSMPILLRAYDDYRPALYVYLVIPFVGLLGLTTIAVRLPSVLLSIATVIASFFLAREFFRQNKQRNWIGLVTMLLLAISPFHIYISRLGHEVNPGLAFVVFGTLCFLLALNHSKWKWILVGASIFWPLSFYTYQSEKVFVPLLVIVLVCMFWRQVWQNKTQAIVALFLGIAITIPIFLASLTPGALLRLKGTSVFTDNKAYDVSAQLLLKDKLSHNFLGEVLHNRRITSLSIFIQNYGVHFNPLWWYGNTGDEIFKVPSLGLFYIWEFPLLFLGIYALWKSEINKKIKAVFVLWILAAFIAPGLTTQTPHAMRSYNLLPIPQIIEAFGAIWLFGFIFQIKSRRIKRFAGIIVLSLLLGLIITSVAIFSFFYFYIFPKRQSIDFQYALGKAIIYVAHNKSTYKHVYITNRINGYQSYMLYLYYTAYSPSKYLKNGGTKSGGFQEIHMIDNITFDVVGQIPGEKDMLYITNTERLNTNVKAVFHNLDGTPALFAWTVEGK